MATYPSSSPTYPSDIELHFAQAHAEFIERVKQAALRAHGQAAAENTRASKNYQDRRAGNCGTLKSCEEHGIVEAVRRYGGPRTGMLRIEPLDAVAFLAGVRARLVLNISQRTERVAKLGLQYYRQDPASAKASQARASHIVALGYLEGYKRTLEIFDSCFSRLLTRLTA